MKIKDLRIGHLPDKSKGEARHFVIGAKQHLSVDQLVKARLALMMVLGKIGNFIDGGLSVSLGHLPRRPNSEFSNDWVFGGSVLC